VLNALFNKVASNPDLKDKIKFLAAAQGQDEKVAKMWKAVRKVPFPVVPDTDWKLSKAMNYRLAELAGRGGGADDGHALGLENGVQAG